MDINIYCLGIAGILGISIIGATAVYSGYDGAVITGSIATISAIITGIIAYIKGKKSAQQ